MICIAYRNQIDNCQNYYNNNLHSNNYLCVTTMHHYGFDNHRINGYHTQYDSVLCIVLKH